MKYLKPTISAYGFTSDKLYPVVEIKGAESHATILNDYGNECICRVNLPSFHLNSKGVFKLVDMPDVNEVRQCATASGFFIFGENFFSSSSVPIVDLSVSEVKVDAKMIKEIGEIIDPAPQPLSDIEDQVRKALRVPVGFDTVKFCKAIRHMADCWIDAGK